MKALFFDVFGTLVDWRSGVAGTAQSILEPQGIMLDWQAFADAWRDEYQPAMQEVRSGKMPYTKLDVLHRRTLQKILPHFGLTDLTQTDLDRLTFGWHQLDAWPDVQAGLSMLRRRYLIAPVSNGNTSLICDLARRNDLFWDAILGADYARAFKPMREVYLTAADAFNLAPEQCLMCAAHSSDLKAAAANGLRTAYIARPQERPGVSESTAALSVDVSVASVLDLALRLGA
ncbi:MAG TPA: haloacid dehalogenase type II [Steroidobacteraceae bacterium]